MAKSSKLINRLRDIKETILPYDGAWVVIRGNPHTARGLRIPTSIREEGIQHFDICWAYNEACPWESHAQFYKQILDEDLVDLMCTSLNISATYGSQLTWFDLHTPSSAHIRMYAGEVSVFSQGLIDELLREDCIEIISFSKVVNSPVWDDLTRDMVDSLRLDGLSYQQAQDMMIKAGELKKKDRKVNLPSFFYRPIGGFRETFCEEPEYELWQKALGE